MQHYVKAQTSPVTKGHANHHVPKSSRPFPSEKPPTHNYCIMEYGHAEEEEGFEARQSLCTQWRQSLIQLQQ